jgi:hypothetical protein
MISSVPNPYFSWASLEQVPGLCAMPVSWKRRLGPAFELFRSRFLRVNPAIANIPSLPIEHVPLEFDWREFGAQLADALECQRKLNATGFSHTYQVGSWSDAAIPVYLSINAAERDFIQAATGLAALLRQRFILFAPTHHYMTGLVQGILRSHDAAFFTLEANVRLRESGRLQTLTAPGQLFARYNPPVDEEPERTAKAVLAMLSRLDPQAQRCKAPPSLVLRLYCVDGLEADQIAARCRCARSLVYSRLQMLRQKLGCDPAELRRHSAHLESFTNHLHDSRARHIRVRAAMEIEEPEEP